MTAGFLARKGEANPATTHHGGASRFQAQRVVVLPPIALHRTSVSNAAPHKLPRRAANMAKPFRAPVTRRKFTFRIEQDRHSAFCTASDQLGISRQELLTRALDSYLETLQSTTEETQFLPVASPPYRVSLSSDSSATLQLPL